MQTNQFDLFKTKRFLPLFITQFLGAFNDNIFKNALAVLIAYRITEIGGMSPQILVMLATGIFILPFFLFSATAGQLADKYEKASFIRVTKFAEILVVALASIGFYLHNIPLLMMLLFLLGIQAAFFGPVKYAILPEQLHENELIAGNGLIEAGTFLAILLGTILSGLIILKTMGPFIISIIMCIFAISGFVSSLFVPKQFHPPRKMQINYNFMTQTFQVLRYSNENATLFLCIMGISWFWLLGSILVAEFPSFTKEILHADEHVVTFFFAIFSIGIGLGSLLCNQLLKGAINATIVPIGGLGMSIFIGDLFFAAHTPQLASDDLVTLPQFFLTFQGWRITFDLLIAAIAGGIYTVPLYAILQQKSEANYRARMIASNNIMNALFMVVGAILTMLLLKVGFSVTHLFVIIASINIIVTLYIYKFNRLQMNDKQLPP